MTRAFELRKASRPTELQATLTIDAPAIELNPKGYLVLLDANGTSITIAMPPPGYELKEIPESQADDREVIVQDIRKALHDYYGAQFPSHLETFLELKLKSARALTQPAPPGKTDV